MNPNGKFGIHQCSKVSDDREQVCLGRSDVDLEMGQGTDVPQHAIVQQILADRFGPVDAVKSEGQVSEMGEFIADEGDQNVDVAER